MTAAAVVELLHDAFTEEFSEQRAQAYLSKFMQTEEPWTFETLSAVTVEATETHTALPQKHCRRITRLAHEVAEWMGGPADSAKYALCVSYTDAGRAAASTAAAVLANESVGPRRGQEGTPGESTSSAEEATEPTAGNVTPPESGRNHIAGVEVEQQRVHVAQAARGETTSPIGVREMSGDTATPPEGGGTSCTRKSAHGGVQVAQDVDSTNPQRHQQQQNMVSSLKQRTLSRAMIGYETQWYAAAADALARLGEELKLSDVQQYYSEQCTAGRELFMREWNRKTIGILSHRKRKLIKKTTK